MALLGELEGLFRAAIRSRGVSYRSRVRLLEAGPAEVKAEVRGTAPYAVWIYWDEPRLLLACSCPYAERGELCKHVWATLLVATAAGHLHAVHGVKSVYSDPESFEPGEAERRKPASRPSSGAPPRLDGGKPDEPPFEADEMRGEDAHVDLSDDDAERGWDAAYPQAHRPPERWEQALSSLRIGEEQPKARSQAPWYVDPTYELLYVLNPQEILQSGAIVVTTMLRHRKKNGAWAKPSYHGLLPEHAQGFQGEERRVVELLAELAGRGTDPGRYLAYSSYGERMASPSVRLGPRLVRELLPALCATGRCCRRLQRQAEPGERKPDPEFVPLRWDEGAPWRLRVRVEAQELHYRVSAELVREGEAVPLPRAHVLLRDGFVMFDDALAALDVPAFGWVVMFRHYGELRVPREARGRLLEALYRRAGIELALPEELRVSELRTAPVPRLLVRHAERSRFMRATPLVGELAFDYDGLLLPYGTGEPVVLDTQRARRVSRDGQAEERAAAFLREQGWVKQRGWGVPPDHFELRTPHKLPEHVATLIEAGWRVEAEGKLFRRAGRLSVGVRSGVDWFGLDGSAEFEGQTVPFPRLLRAIRRGQRTVELGDGSFGVLPAEWLERYGRLSALASGDEEQARFAPTQAALLDALLASLPEVDVDAVFARARRELGRFERIAPRSEPAGFVGELRPYQRDGLGWLAFLEQMGFGGCLADDMGLGKTVQVLAMLEARRAAKKRKGSVLPRAPSLVVVPRSLLFNWVAEAKRFTPKLALYVHDGPSRASNAEPFAGHDVVLMTYGLLRRDVRWLAETDFDYVVLDEAQAVKNAATDVAKAARTLRAHHRLALSGTPIENHLGELWSLFEFLNPGMLGTSAFVLLLDADSRNPSPQTLEMVARAVRPFILRRTKEQVAKELPRKHEQTIYCELEGPQRALYDELRAHYQASLLQRIDEVGLGRSKMQVLEALLRLRQAACHPGLLDERRRKSGAAKLEVLLPMLDELVAAGHKALVFSQFTSLLALVRAELDAGKVSYAYLDGQTRDREAVVARFQTDAACPLMLVSLKAGGLGLNLTAADYVFLLDPWWNPAVEAQAIDRAHRIGQDKQVFAYRLVARDTIEEKILELQAQKRSLAEGIVRADGAVLRQMGREELEALLR